MTSIGHMLSSRMDTSQCSTTGRLDSQAMLHVHHACMGNRRHRGIEFRHAAGQYMRRERGSPLVLKAVKKGFGSEPVPPPEEKDIKKKGRPKKNAPGANKGFGAADTVAEEKKKIRVKKSSQKVVDDAVRLAEGGHVRPVDPKEAAKGKVDRVQVRSWGSGVAPEDLGSLQVESFRPGAPINVDLPFYEQLARRLEWLERRNTGDNKATADKAQGALRIAEGPTDKPLPPFERWGFTERRYIQYLCDQQAIHSQLESAIEDALAYAVATPSSEGSAQAAAFTALNHFSERRGLDRSLEIMADLNEIAKSSQLPSNEVIVLDPTQNTQGYTLYLGGLGLLCQDSETSDKEREEATLRLIANAYAIQVTHLTTGFRIGAAAAEKLDLFRVGAVNFYQNYPSPLTLKGADPLRAFISNVNAVGQILSATQKESVMEELPKGVVSCAKTLYILAHE